MTSEGTGRRRIVVFVCAHGAVRSRLAAALFNQLGHSGWWAWSVGLDPQSELGETARRLLEGSDAKAFLDTGPPHALDASSSADAVIAIDCRLAGSELWRLERADFGQPMVEELRRRVVELARRLTGSPL